jgi:hypothetical protein
MYLYIGIIVPLFTNYKNSREMNHQTLSTLLKTSAILWAIWGIFHLFIGVAMIVLFKNGYPSGDFQEIPETLNFTMFGMESLFAPIATLKQHAFNLAWIGAIVTVGSFYVWNKNKLGIFTCAVIGGLADIGYFLYIDLPGYAFTPGPEMTYIMALAIILAFYAYFKSDKLSSFNHHAES